MLIPTSIMKLIAVCSARCAGAEFAAFYVIKGVWHFFICCLERVTWQIFVYSKFYRCIRTEVLISLSNVYQGSTYLWTESAEATSATEIHESRYASWHNIYTLKSCTAHMLVLICMIKHWKQRQAVCCSIIDYSWWLQTFRWRFLS